MPPLVGRTPRGFDPFTIFRNTGIFFVAEITVGAATDKWLLA
jgi:hypothetical protein